ncbi:MAG: cellulase family glycosylhydrolase [Kiritimatiellae bacterium]|nr:cellulase family glycosylhydrolase [Kiritimatiellia bacterium]
MYFFRMFRRLAGVVCLPTLLIHCVCADEGALRLNSVYAPPHLELSWQGGSRLQGSTDLLSWSNMVVASPFVLDVVATETSRLYFRLCDYMPAPLSRLVISNAQIVVAESGVVPQLRGVNVDMFFYVETNNPTAVWNYVDEWALDQVQADGANLIRLCLNAYMIAEMDPVRLRTNNLAKYREIIDWCMERDIYVVLDLHCPPGCVEVDDGSFWLESQVAQNTADFLDLWRLLAAEFAGNTTILGYDLFNEPRPPDEDDWWSLVDLAVQAIREVDSQHIIVVEPPLGNRTEAFQRVNDPSVLYSFHFYEPLAVTHRASNWSGDTLMPTNPVYPGSVLVGQTELTYAPPGSMITGTHDWMEVSTTNIVAPAGSGYATLVAFAQNGSVDIYYDDFTVTRNGESVDLVNAAILEESPFRPDWPKAWFAQAEGDYLTIASRTVGYLQPGALHISGSGTLGYWHQYDNAFLTTPLIEVEPGDHLEARAMVRSTGSIGSGGVTLLFYSPTMQYVDRSALKAYVEAEYLNWLVSNNVPGYVGEFGCMATDTDETASALLADMASIWNEKGLPWTSWTLRDWFTDEADYGMGLIQAAADEKPGASRNFRQSLYGAWTNALYAE